MNSKISTIYVLAQYKPDSLMRHIAASSAPWLNAPGSVIKVLLPRSNRQLVRRRANSWCTSASTCCRPIRRAWWRSRRRPRVPHGRAPDDRFPLRARGRGERGGGQRAARESLLIRHHQRARRRPRARVPREAAGRHSESAQPGAGVRVHGQLPLRPAGPRARWRRASRAAKSISAATCCRGSASRPASTRTTSRRTRCRDSSSTRSRRTGATSAR